MNDYIRELLAGELRRRAPHVVPNPEDCYVYCLADELLAEGHETIRTFPAAELDARIRANTLKAAEDYPEDFEDDDTGGPDDDDPAECWQWFESAPANVPTTRRPIAVYAPALAAEDDDTPDAAALIASRAMALAMSSMHSPVADAVHTIRGQAA